MQVDVGLLAGSCTLALEKAAWEKGNIVSLPTAGAPVCLVWQRPLLELWLVRDDVIGLLECGWWTEPIFRPSARWPYPN